MIDDMSGAIDVTCSAEPNFVALYGSPTAFDELSERIGRGLVGTITLSGRLASVPQVHRRDALQVVTEDEGPVDVQLGDSVVVIAGGRDALAHLAQSLRNLAISPTLTGPLMRHVDFTYFPGHPWLSPDSIDLTAFLIPPDQHPC